MGQGWQQAHLHLLLKTYGMKVIVRNRDTTSVCKLLSRAALRFYLKHFIRKTPQYDNSTRVWMQRNLDAQVTCWTSLPITFSKDLHRNTHVHHMHTQIFRSHTAYNHLKTTGELHKRHTVKIGSREAEMWLWMYKSSTRRRIFFWHRRKKKTTKKTPPKTQPCPVWRIFPEQNTLNTIKKPKL